MDRKKLILELETKGYCVVPNILTEDECNRGKYDFIDWLKRFGNDRPYSKNSLLQQYRLSHSEPAWTVRLKAKPVFASIWKTDKLFTSMDGVAISEPPELGNTDFGNPDTNWFHMDQGRRRKGLHGYQGGVYLEETTESDYCFRVLENSVQFHSEFYQTFSKSSDIKCNNDMSKKKSKESEEYKKTEFIPKSNEEGCLDDYFALSQKHIDWYVSKGCKMKKVPVPKGGMVLWDSRTIHDNKAPTRGRPFTDRWRLVIFVCMAPAIWATDKDVELKKKAYNELVTTNHWPSQGVFLFPKTSDREETKVHAGLDIIKRIENVAKNKDVRQLVGIEQYDFDNGKPNDPGWEPRWID